MKTIELGRYWQSNGDEKEPIEWMVLDRDDKRILLISKYALGAEPYNSIRTDVTWEKCSLRKWLNGTFLNEAFSEEERNRILSIDVSADKNPDYSTNPGNNTIDKVFLLSISEANKYFRSRKARMCAATDYLTAQGGLWIDDENKIEGKGACWWWLRSPGDDNNAAAGVCHDGDIITEGDFVETDFDAVRPAMWVKI